jgi:hypothetical protein
MGDDPGKIAEQMLAARWDGEMVSQAELDCRVWAKRFRACWTPERRAFMEAAEKWNRIRDDVSNCPLDEHTAEGRSRYRELVNLLNEAEREMREAWRAMKRAEEGAGK